LQNKQKYTALKINAFIGTHRIYKYLKYIDFEFRTVIYFTIKSCAIKLKINSIELIILKNVFIYMYKRIYINIFNIFIYQYKTINNQYYIDDVQ